MTTFLTMISSVLPGARSIRAPMFAGLLWTLFLWLLVADEIPGRSESTGIALQAYAVIAFLGYAGTLLVASVLVFIVGATATFAINGVSQAIGRALQRVAAGLEWQRFARRRRRMIRGWVRGYNRTIALEATIPGPSSNSDGTTAVESVADRHLRMNAKQARQNREEAIEKLSALEPRTGWKWFYRYCWIRNDSLTQSALGRPPSNDEVEVAERIIQQAYNGAAMDYAESINFDGWPDHAWAGGIDQDFLAEFKPDPVEALKALDNDLFVEADRERSERELRVAISGPLIAIATVGILEVSAWFYLLLILALGLLCANSVSPASERSRIMKQVSLKGKETPAMRAAAVQAKRDVIEAKIKAQITPAINPIPPAVNARPKRVAQPDTAEAESTGDSG